jgi:hypothetical protein
MGEDNPLSIHKLAPPQNQIGDYGGRLDTVKSLSISAARSRDRRDLPENRS